jgi:hypothetical protein
MNRATKNKEMKENSQKISKEDLIQDLIIKFRERETADRMRETLSKIQIMEAKNQDFHQTIA